MPSYVISLALLTRLPDTLDSAGVASRRLLNIYRSADHLVNNSLSPPPTLEPTISPHLVLLPTSITELFRYPAISPTTTPPARDYEDGIFCPYHLLLLCRRPNSSITAADERKCCPICCAILFSQNTNSSHNTIPYHQNSYLHSCRLV